MYALTKKFAAFEDSRGRALETIEIKDEAHAAVAAEADAFGFTTFERDVLRYDGQDIQGDLKNRTAFVYANVDKLWSRDDVAAYCQAELETARGQKGLLSLFTKASKISTLEKLVAFADDFEADARFVQRAGRPVDFLVLQDNDKAYDSRGKQVWPATQAPELAQDNTPGF